MTVGGGVGDRLTRRGTTYRQTSAASPRPSGRSSRTAGRLAALAGDLRCRLQLGAQENFVGADVASALVAVVRDHVTALIGGAAAARVRATDRRAAREQRHRQRLTTVVLQRAQIRIDRALGRSDQIPARGGEIAVPVIADDVVTLAGDVTFPAGGGEPSPSPQSDGINASAAEFPAMMESRRKKSVGHPPDGFATSNPPPPSSALLVEIVSCSRMTEALAS